MIGLEPELRSVHHHVRTTTRRVRALAPDLCRGIGVAMLAVMVMSFLAALAFHPFMHA